MPANLLIAAGLGDVIVLELRRGMLDDIRILNRKAEFDEVTGLHDATRPRFVTWTEIEPD